MQKQKFILLIIVVSQFCCTSLWFAGNGVMNDLLSVFSLEDNALGHLTSAVQFGFITGTFTFALFTLVDRYSPSKIFFVCALLGALFNFGITWEANNLISLLGLRFLTGFFLAGIYPVGMKIATDYFEKGLGKSLGYLVGALVVGTALPHLLKAVSVGFPWKSVLISTSVLAIFGGALMLVLVPDGPNRRAGQGLKLSAFFDVFRNPKFRVAAFGYFGHMWELYTFWAFVPIMLNLYMKLHPETIYKVPILSFAIIAIGGLACVFGGYVAPHIGTKKTATIFLSLSCLCCLISPFMFSLEYQSLFIAFLLFWGIVVIADSPLFSTLVAQNAEPQIKGTALTIVNCIGFFITIISIQVLNMITSITDSNMIFMILAIGPIIGLYYLREKRNIVQQI